MKTCLFAGLFAPTFLLATAALADPKGACLDAASSGQRLRDAHKLVEAREPLRACAAAECPAVVRSDCAGWLADVEKALPTVVFAARNRAGADLVDVKVSVDGQPLASTLDGQAVPMNAGPHTFHFEGAPGALDLQVVVREGERNQPIAVVLGPMPVEQPVEGRPSSPLRTLGWVLGGAGVVGLAVGAVFGIVAIGDKNKAHCGSNDQCDPGTSSGIKNAALASDVGWVAGGVLLGGGAALVLFAPKSHEVGVSVSMAPAIAAGGGQLVVGGHW
jgi:hypothetical protein